MKLTPRNDLKARITLSGLRYTEFARRYQVNARTLYAVLDGKRINGPEAQRIVKAIEKHTPPPAAASLSNN
jgi:predicted transcriptional regulator